MLYQQGDVLIKAVKEVKGKKLDHLILAQGEATGHCHEIKKGNAELYEEGGVLYLKVMDDEVKIQHQEHKEISIPKGDYFVRRVREYDHFAEEARNVRD